MPNQSEKPVVVAVSGGFDPIHPGHVRMFRAAKALGDKLVVILNNDNWIKLKKCRGFMPEKQRKEVIQAMRDVDLVIISRHGKNTKDMSVRNELLALRPNIFANGGDRKLGNIPEAEICATINCKMVFGIGQGGKVESSSWLLKNYVEGIK